MKMYLEEIRKSLIRTKKMKFKDITFAMEAHTPSDV